MGFLCFCNWPVVGSDAFDTSDQSGEKILVIDNVEFYSAFLIEILIENRVSPCGVTELGMIIK